MHLSSRSALSLLRKGAHLGRGKCEPSVLSGASYGGGGVVVLSCVLVSRFQ